MMGRTFFLLSLIGWLATCTSSPPAEEKQVMEPQTAYRTKPLPEASDSVDQLEQTAANGFEQALHLLESNGFHHQERVVLRSPEQYRQHWWLKKYYSGSKRHQEAPTTAQLETIRSVSQHIFTKQWKVYLEIWEFQDHDAAHRWNALARKATGPPSWYLEKPPNDFWLDDGRLHMIMATAARDWFALGDTLVYTWRGN